MTLWTIAHQAPLSMGLSRQEYWSGLPCPPPGDLPDPGIQLLSLLSYSLTSENINQRSHWNCAHLFRDMSAFFAALESNQAFKGFPSALAVKNPPASVGDVKNVGLIPGSGRSPGGGHANPLQCSCLENPMDRGARRATVRGVAQGRTRPK